MSDIYKKVGRGGAGNYYSKQDIADATKNVSSSCSRMLIVHALLFATSNSTTLSLRDPPFQTFLFQSHH